MTIFGKLKDGEAFYYKHRVWIKVEQIDFEWNLEKTYYAKSFVNPNEKIMLCYKTKVEKL